MSASEGKSDEKSAGAGNGRKRWYVPKGLSGKLLILTMVVIMLTEIFVFVPSVANFRLTWLSDHFVTGEAASLALERLPERERLLARLHYFEAYAQPDIARMLGLP